MTKWFLIFSLLFTLGCSKDNNDDGEDNNPDPPVIPKCDPIPRAINETLTEDALLDVVQAKTLRYFWDFAEPESGMARERNTSGNTITTGGSGFGIMAMIAGAERGFLDRNEVVDRMLKICNFLDQADRYHGAWSHWMDGTTGKTIAFSQKDNGGDLVETAFLVQGLIAAKQYFDQANPKEDSLRAMVDSLWYAVEWNWYTQNQNVLFWHWSKEYGFEMNHEIRGWNEGLIIYVLAAASPTYPIAKEVYTNGWANNGNIRNGKSYYEKKLPLGPDYGGPLFFAHYSFLGLDPRNLEDGYANYWEQNVNHSLINFEYCKTNPYDFCNYSDSCWGLTASDDPIVGYQAHAPFQYWGKDNGTISPTAAISSMPYTPEQSIKALEFFYYYLSNKLFGAYGFRDAFNIEEDWYASSTLAIDQGPIVVMIENYRSALLWQTFMKDEDVKNGLNNLDFIY